MAAAIGRHHLAPGLIELELTETMLMRDVDRTIRTLVRLREMGVRLSIDDFGTGYSSLNYLRQFPVNALKIDRSFVGDIGSDGAEGIAAAIVGMAHSLGLEAVAEGVETETQRAFLQMHGCHQLQGYLIARPARARDRALPEPSRLNSPARRKLAVAGAAPSTRRPPCRGSAFNPHTETRP